MKLSNISSKPELSGYALSNFKRQLDIALVVPASLALLIPFLVTALAVKVSSRGPIFFRSQRVGSQNTLFTMLKFRTMRVDTPLVATHELGSPGRWLTPIGGFLRKSSLDELPQLINVLAGHMSLVGPRPALFNQDDLIAGRTAKGVHQLTPGITGLAQVNGRDELSIGEKVLADAEYLASASFIGDMKILLTTIAQVFVPRGVQH
jgi:O-antigen biosynthesis protein WbqP